MKQILPFIITTAIILGSCRGGENKADPSDTMIEKPATDTVTTAAPPAAKENVKDNAPDRSGQTRGLEPSTGPSEILSKIDEHLVSAAQYTAVPSGGITNGTITVTNTLPDVDFQKVMVEAKTVDESGKEIRTDYYTLINIEPGMSKAVKTPNTTQGAKMITHVIKVKSAELTKGEFVMAGIHFAAN